MEPPRFPITEAPDPESCQQLVQQGLESLYSGPPPFPWVDEGGVSLIGCYAPLSYSPAFIEQYFKLAQTLYSDSTLVKPRNREIAILGLASALKDIPFIVHCHRKMAGRMGVTNEQYQQGLAGQVPTGLTDEEGMAYRLGRVLATMQGRLDNETWQEALDKMGDKAQIVGIVQVVAGYKWVAMLEQVNGDTRMWDKDL